MFRDRKLWEVNREERSFCALFAHALLTASTVRDRLTLLGRERWSVEVDARSLEVYVEVAALRDYWYDLGDPRAYSDDTHGKRRAVLETILVDRGLEPTVLDQSDFFWTSPARRKLWSPGRWSKTQLSESGLDSALLPVRWAFNAKPDLLIGSADEWLLVEGKVESPEGRQDSGYLQRTTQELIGHLLRLLVPAFATARLTQVLLAIDPVDPLWVNRLSWRDVLEMIEGAGLDEFTAKALVRLRTFYTS